MKIFKVIKGIWWYFWGHLLLIRRYDSKYFCGKEFQGRLNGLCAIGWKIAVKDALSCHIHGVNQKVRWPVNPCTTVVGAENISFDPHDIRIFQVPGCYYQGIGRITIGSGCYIAPNVGLITANHAIENLDDHQPPKDIIIGKNCWIGMGSVILPGVELGDHTIVGAGSVVTKSYKDGNCIIAGNPAKPIRFLGDA